jgi:endonuclease/exonuclease/phosphatase family metal-dependent hydrolase
MDRIQDGVDGHDRRVEEAAKTVEFVKEVAGDSAIVLMGTLNALPGSDEIEVLTGAGFNDVWEAGRGEGYTRDGARNTNIVNHFTDPESGEQPRRDRVDYIFFKGDGVSVKRAAIALDAATYEIHPSDHFAVTAELEF